MDMRGLYRLARETKAATAVEYGLIVALIFLAILVGVVALANTTVGMWNNVQGSDAGARLPTHSQHSHQNDCRRSALVGREKARFRNDRLIEVKKALRTLTDYKARSPKTGLLSKGARGWPVDLPRLKIEIEEPDNADHSQIHSQ